LFRSCFCLDTGNRYKFSDKVTAELEQTAEYDLSLGLYKPFKFARQALLRILWSTALHVDNLFYDLIFKVFMMVFTEFIYMDFQQMNDNTPSSSDSSTAEYFLERIYSHLLYYEYDRANSCLEKALEKANITLELAGAFGKRTKFQSRDIPQLILKATPIDEEQIEDFDSPVCSLPLNVSANDDTLLETVRFSENVERRKLNSLQTACILATCQINLRTQHRDDLVIEKCLTFVITQKPTWAVYVCALTLRCELEKHRMRRVERACSQIEVISKIVDGVDDNVLFEKLRRIYLVLGSGLQPFWRIHKLHGKILLSLGCSEALKVYERLEDWDSVVGCYKSVGQLEKAERIVRQLIEKDSSNPINYCLLGDITLKSDYYETAIKVSEGRCARAYKSLGNLMLIRNRFEEALKNFKKSLELQQIQLGVWFNLGHCAWKLELYQEAASAYHHCVHLEPDHFEAWNNLAAAYIRLNQKQRARKILREALKFNYDHANIWENYLLVCVDTGDFLEAIQAFHRLLDLRKSQKDDEVIEVLCKQTMEMSQVLFFTSPLLVWHSYATLKKPLEVENLDEYESYVHCLDRAFRSEFNKQV
uniref:TPR_REGION domain-containing protein n=1 Tax=Enterobius vermicularis TaxID=51028 RepID=A0A0N4V7F5_ENTVE